MPTDDERALEFISRMGRVVEALNRAMDRSIESHAQTIRARLADDPDLTIEAAVDEFIVEGGVRNPSSEVAIELRLRLIEAVQTASS